MHAKKSLTGNVHSLQIFSNYCKFSLKYRKEECRNVLNIVFYHKGRIILSTMMQKKTFICCRRKFVDATM